MVRSWASTGPTLTGPSKHAMHDAQTVGLTQHMKGLGSNAVTRSRHRPAVLPAVAVVAAR